MNISINWLRKYINLPEDINKLSDALTFSGIEVESVKNISALADTIVTAKVISAEPVINTDHLKHCKVDIGSYDIAKHLVDETGLLDVVCGASNCHAGMIAVLALPGTELNGITITSAKIRGVTSHGMLCSERELGLSDDHSGILELPLDTKSGVSPNEILELPDQIFELEITPNRSDLLGLLGIARDLSASLKRSMNVPDLTPYYETTGSLGLNVELHSNDLCPRYTARMFENVKVNKSPLWLRMFLVKMGLRPINNIVDITNYVMLLTGQPLHAFDYNLLAKKSDQDSVPSIIIRRAESEESIIALDNLKYVLDENDLVIADGVRASAIAGVIGSHHSGINDSTTNIVLEVASFDPGSIRRTSYKHKISTDSSYRFERGLSPQKIDYASSLAVQLLIELATPEHIGFCHEVGDYEPQDRILGIRPKRFEKLIGYKLNDNEIRTYLESLGLEFIQFGNWIDSVKLNYQTIYCHHADEISKGVSELTEDIDCVHSHYYKVPSDRIDLEREIDLIEELARLAGYDRVPQKQLVSSIMDKHSYELRRKVQDYFVSRGFFEILTYSWDDKNLMLKLGYNNSDPIMQMPQIMNPQASNQSYMRGSLVPSVLGRLAYNLNYGERLIRLFELSKVYRKQSDAFSERYSLCAAITGDISGEYWQTKGTATDLFFVKGIFEQLVDLLRLGMIRKDHIHEPFLIQTSGFSYYSGSEIIGSFGKLKPSVAESFGIDTITLKQDIWIVLFDIELLSALTQISTFRFTPVSKYPLVTRDISLLLKNEHSYEKLKEQIFAVNQNLIEEVIVFDEYRSEKLPTGYRSLSLHLRIRDQQKTLTEERIDKLVDSILKKIQDDLEVIMR